MVTSQRIKVSPGSSICIYNPTPAPIFSTILHRLYTWARTGLFQQAPGSHAESSMQTAVVLKPAMGSGHTRPPFSTVDSNIAVQATQTHTHTHTHTGRLVVDTQPPHRHAAHTHTHTEASQCNTNTSQAAVILGPIMCILPLYFMGCVLLCCHSGCLMSEHVSRQLHKR